MNHLSTLERAIKLIKLTPYTRAIILTGSMAEGRANESSDIDLFIQVKPGHLWLTRLLVTIIISLVGIRRTEHKIAGRICLNWFATFNAPQQQVGRVYKELWREAGETTWIKNCLEILVDYFNLIGLEKIVKKIQIKRILNDPRTHLQGSQVRFNDTELGFHPPKKSTRSNK